MRFIGIIATVAVSLILAGCATGPVTQSLTEAQLRQAAASKFGTDQYVETLRLESMTHITAPFSFAMRQCALITRWLSKKELMVSLEKAELRRAMRDA